MNKHILEKHSEPKTSDIPASDKTMPKDYKRKYPGAECKTPGCDNMDLDMMFFGPYCHFCGCFIYFGTPNHSQAHKNSL